MPIALYGIKTEVEGIQPDGWCHTPGGAIPYNSLCELMPYTSPSVLNKNNLNRKNRFRLFLVTRTGIILACEVSHGETASLWPRTRRLRRRVRFRAWSYQEKREAGQMSCFSFSGDPYGNRTHVTAVKGPCLNRLTNGPSLVADVGFEPTTCRVWTGRSSQLS